jgi:amidase
LTLFASTVVGHDPWRLDSSVIYTPWRSVAPKEKLKLGFILEDPSFPVHPPVLNTLTRTVEALKAAGHEVVDLATPSARDATVLAFRMFSMDPANTALKHIQASGEPRIPALSSTDLPHPDMPYDYAPLTLEGLYDLNVQRAEFKEQFRLLITQAGIDAIIMPGYQGTAVRHDMIGWVPYTVLLNLLDV